MYKCLDKLIALMQSHLEQTFQITRSTNSLILLINSSVKALVWTHSFLTKPITREIATDQKYRLPFQSSLETQYVMICYDYDSNIILTIALKTII